MQQLGMQPAQELRLVGGGSRNELWRQIIADAFQLPVRWGRLWNILGFAKGFVLEGCHACCNPHLQ